MNFIKDLRRARVRMAELAVCFAASAHRSEVDLDDPEEPLDIPHCELSADALAGVVQSFVLREGTDYGEKEYTLAEKVAHVIRQLERGEAKIVFDPRTETVDIVPAR